MLMTISFVNQRLEYPLEYLDGMNLHFANPMYAAGLFILCVVIDVLFSSTNHLTKKWEKKDWQKLWLILVAILGVVVSTIYIKNTTFDSNWGSYRGFIWSQGWDFYTKQPLKEKLFGIGLDLVYPVFYRFYGPEEMLVGGFAYYDNLHNECLQYLVTIGFIGAVFYIAAMGICVYHLIKKISESQDAIVIFVVVICYLVQSFTNISMCCVTALMFVLLFNGQLITKDDKKLVKKK